MWTIQYSLASTLFALISRGSDNIKAGKCYYPAKLKDIKVILFLVPVIMLISGMQIQQSNGLLTKNGICTTLDNEELAEDLFEIGKESQDKDYFLKNMIKDLAEENRELAEITCQNVIDDGNIGP